jgi:hypothetical protein
LGVEKIVRRGMDHVKQEQYESYAKDRGVEQAVHEVQAFFVVDVNAH